MSYMKIRQESDRCLVVELGTAIDETVGLRCLALAQGLRELRLEGVRDVVASYVTVAIHYAPVASLGSDPGATLTHHIRTQLETLQTDGDHKLEVATRRITIPVCYGHEHGPDLQAACEHAGLSEQAFIEAHHARPLRVYMLGFAPGQPYIGIHDARFAIPRRETPRTAVPAGSLGVANRQSTIYPNLLPGGWFIVGATPFALFDPGAAAPTLLQPGDEIMFEPISAKDFDRLKAHPPRSTPS